ncbi:hypothetical protein [Spiroplasma endosymbiont of Panorpa germanica]|uniref:hypothetical protein n=1 Tax=Spiroplasma endosymbiont of Panorpa germanica TaxID=3066314 RepID=UPI0030CF4F12
MEKLIKSKDKWVVILWFVIGASLILSFAFFVVMIEDKIYIRDLPNIEDDFFNGFIVQNVYIYNKAFISYRYLIWDFGNNLFKLGHKMVMLFLFVIMGVLCLAFHSAWYGIELKWARLFIYVSTFFNLFILIALCGTLNKNNFDENFIKQIFDIFGKDFFSTEKLKIELEILKDSINQSVSYYKYLPLNIVALILTIITIVSSIYWIVIDKKNYQKK